LKLAPQCAVLIARARQTTDTRACWTGSSEAKLVSFIARLLGVRPIFRATSTMSGFPLCSLPNGNLQ
jgi:hypothetical protein